MEEAESPGAAWALQTIWSNKQCKRDGERFDENENGKQSLFGGGSIAEAQSVVGELARVRQANRRPTGNGSATIAISSARQNVN